MEIKWGRRLEQQICGGSAGGDQMEAVVVIAGEDDVIAKDLAAKVGWEALCRNVGGSEA